MRQSRAEVHSVSGMSKAQSHASIRMNKVDNERAATFNSDLTHKLSFYWKNIYRSLLQSDVL